MRRKYVLPAVLLVVLVLAAGVLVHLRSPAKDEISMGSGREDASPPVVSSKQAIGSDAIFAGRSAEVVDRQVVTHASLAVTVPKLDEAQAEVLRITTTLGGYVQSSNFNNFTDNQNWSFTLRVPSDKSNEAVRLISALGSVQSSGSNRQDVTEEYMDLEARLTVMRLEESRLLELLRRANTIDDYLKVESHLTRVRIEIEQATGRLKFLTHSVGMATIGLTLTPERGAIPPKPVGFAGLGQRLSAAFRQGLNAVVEIVSGTLVFVVASLPLFLIIVPLFLIGLVLYRRMIPAKKPPAAS